MKIGRERKSEIARCCERSGISFWFADDAGSIPQTNAARTGEKCDRRRFSVENLQHDLLSKKNTDKTCIPSHRGERNTFRQNRPPRGTVIQIFPASEKPSSSVQIQRTMLVVPCPVSRFRYKYGRELCEGRDVPRARKIWLRDTHGTVTFLS